jgi:PPK2 family polyphosphate:nucleotide phosphotransferase
MHVLADDFGREENVMGKPTGGVWEKYRIPSKSKFEMQDINPGSKEGVPDRAFAEERFEKITQRMKELQQVLYAEGKHALLVVLQATDTGGKDGTIRHVFGPLNPQGVRVHSFKAPTAEELSHDYLWRVHNKVPQKGMIGIFNRSHYEDVLIARVHDLAPKKVIKERYAQINNFEKYLSANGVTILKFCLHISKEEQKERLQSRLDRADKHWKFSSGDLAERQRWDAYQDAFGKAISACSTDWAPWYVIPANRKWYRNYVIADIVCSTLENMKLAFPAPEEGLDEIVIDG